MEKVWFYEYEFGMVGIVEKDGFISRVFFADDEKNTNYTQEETALIKKANAQLEEYFSGKRTEFDLPLKMKGTDFQKSVWNVLESIPFGKTLSYKEVAEKIKNPKAVRAVGGACNKNPIAIIVPCHRVVGSNKKLVGFAGGLSTKEYLLGLEKPS